MVRGLYIPFVGLTLISHSLSYSVQSVFLPSRGRGTRGAVASESTICSQIGIDLIDHGVCRLPLIVVVAFLKWIS